MVSPCPPRTKAVTFSTLTFEFLRDESAEAGGVEHSGHADDALARESAQLVGGLRHGVERIRHDDEDAVRRMLHHLADYVAFMIL